jgi:hypothetical protein
MMSKATELKIFCEITGPFPSQENEKCHEDLRNIHPSIEVSKGTIVFFLSI